jgi:hypothetical protein
MGAIMKPVRILTLACVITAAAVVSSYADDRPPTAGERAKIEAALKGAGFVSWQKIELDDGKKLGGR